MSLIQVTLMLHAHQLFTCFYASGHIGDAIFQILKP